MYRSIVTARSQWITHSADAVTHHASPSKFADKPAKMTKKKSSWFSCLKHVLFRPCYHKSGVVEPNRHHRTNSVEPTNAQDSCDVPVQPVPTHETGSELIPSTPHSIQDISFHTIGHPQTHSLENVHEEEDDDDLSVLNLDEAREIAQMSMQRINGIGISTPHEATRPAAGKCHRLPPLDPVYQERAVSTMKKAIENDGHMEGNTNKNLKTDKKVIKTRPPLKRSKNMMMFNLWLEGSIKNVSKRRQVPKDPHGKIAKKHAKIAELYNKISDVEEDLDDKKRDIARLLQRMELIGVNLVPEIKKEVAIMQKLETKLRKHLDEVRKCENKTKQLSDKTATQVPSEDSLPYSVSSENQSESDESDYSSDEEKVDVRSKAIAAPVPIMVKEYRPPSPSNNGNPVFSLRPSTVVQRYPTRYNSSDPRSRVILVTESERRRAF